MNTYRAMIRTGGGDAEVNEWDTHLVLMELVNKQEEEVTNQTNKRKAATEGEIPCPRLTSMREGGWLQGSLGNDAVK